MWQISIQQMGRKIQIEQFQINLMNVALIILFTFSSFEKEKPMFMCTFIHSIWFLGWGW
jgi:hypothetical protein